MNKPDYKLEQSKAKRAADLIELGEEALRILHPDTYPFADRESIYYRALRQRAEELGLLDEEEKP